MITLFTTTKNFIAQIRINQLNAIKCWLSAPVAVEVIIFGLSKGMEELGDHPNLVYIPTIRTSSTGAPFANDLFAAIAKVAKYNICCFVNADILLPGSFFENCTIISNTLKKDYLIVGERLDVDVGELITFNKNWEKDFMRNYQNKLIPHPPGGWDYFLFPKKQYSEGKLPDLLIGRPGWDGFMVYHARKNNYKVIDFSPSISVIHQNHDYSHISVHYSNFRNDPELMLNVRWIPEAYWYKCGPSICNYKFVNGKFRLKIKKYLIDNIKESRVTEIVLSIYFICKRALLKFKYIFIHS